MNFLEDLNKMLQNHVDSIREDIIRIAEYIYNNPELGYAEFKASKLLSSILEESGFEVTSGRARLPTAFKGVIKGYAPLNNPGYTYHQTRNNMG
jgi:metal-dependent amidase/aminoacylase/carboxypeptidase family protein